MVIHDIRRRKKDNFAVTFALFTSITRSQIIKEKFPRCNLSLFLSMIDTSDICGCNYGPNDHSCGGCSVDLQEPDGPKNRGRIRKKDSRTLNKPPLPLFRYRE
jgi:hypothetical protein